MTRRDRFNADAPGRVGTSPRPLLRIALALAGIPVLAGCEVNSFFDPSKVGRFSDTPTTLPVLQKIDMIEAESSTWSNAGRPLPEDLVPSDVLYRLAPGDVLRVEIYELLREREMAVTIVSVDQAGKVRLPTVGDVPAAGRTPAELQDEIVLRLGAIIQKDPIVNVTLEEERNLTFSILGRAAGAGAYRLTRPDLRLLEALAIAGGAPETTDKLYIVRRVALAESVSAPWELRTPGGGALRPARPEAAPVDIEQLIRELEQRQGGGAAPDGPSPAALRQSAPPAVDVDDLEPVRVSDRPMPSPRPAGGSARAGAGDAFVFDVQKNAWVRVAATAAAASPAAQADARSPTQVPGQDILDAAGTPVVGAPGGDQPLFAERVLVIDFKRLISGDSSQNVVIRPNDLIYVQPQAFGFVYVQGEILRPGSYDLPITGGLTLARLVAAAGGLNGIAIPERVDLTRTVGPNREATIRVNFGAIMRRTEPDFILKPDDLITIGTNFWAVPLAVVRNGFRTTYGFGFLLDRNFGNDVFGPPPTNVLGG